MINKNMRNERSFTLIEILIVIAVIGLLVSIVLVSIGDAGANLRDSIRKKDLDQIRKALMLYAHDHDYELPDSGFGAGGDGGSGGGFISNKENEDSCYLNGDLEDFLDGTDPDIPLPAKLYIRMPHDPKCGGCAGCFASGVGAPGYMYYGDSHCGVLYASLEKPSQEDLDTCDSHCLGGGIPYGGFLKRLIIV
jgi:prepilin-type N-terminal cleavage/methylation domain-containing protein